MIDPVPALQAVHQQATRQQAPSCQQLVLLVVWQGRESPILGDPVRSILASISHQLNQQTTLAKAGAAGHGMISEFVFAPSPSQVV
jgi:hypothetical protein